MKKVLLIFTLFVFIFLGSAQELVPGENYSISCETDLGCRLDVPAKLLECLLCDSYECRIYEGSDENVIAVSRNWTPNCSWREVPEDERDCPDCRGFLSTDGYEAKCINNECVKLEVSNDLQNCSSEGEMCGGIAGFVCCDSLTCELEEDYPDAAGTCVSVEEFVCNDLCDDGECQETVCQGEGCPCAETIESCPSDCQAESDEGGFSLLTWFIILVILVFLVILGLKIAKWLFWSVIIATILLIVLWVFVF